MNNSVFLLSLLKCRGIGNKKVLDFFDNYSFEYNDIAERVTEIVDVEEYNKALKIATIEVEKNLNAGVRIITVFDEAFPKKMLIKSDPILYLYYLGDISLINNKSIAIIGSRKANDENLKKTKVAAKLFSDNGFTIVSGLALGVDTYAHEGTIEAEGKTIAVLPSGLDNIVPWSNRDLAKRIIKNGGCLVSEYSVGTMLNKFNYTKRDRIQGALADVVLVTEASETSGTMFAVKTAQKEGKPVFQLNTNRNSLINNNVDIDSDIDMQHIMNSIGIVTTNEQLSFFDNNDASKRST